MLRILSSKISLVLSYRQGKQLIIPTCFCTYFCHQEQFILFCNLIFLIFATQNQFHLELILQESIWYYFALQEMVLTACQAMNCAFKKFIRESKRLLTNGITCQQVINLSFPRGSHMRYHTKRKR